MQGPEYFAPRNFTRHSYRLPLCLWEARQKKGDCTRFFYTKIIYMHAKFNQVHGILSTAFLVDTAEYDFELKHKNISNVRLEK